MPLLNRRRLRPEMLIDLNRVADIDGISFRDGFLAHEAGRDFASAKLNIRRDGAHVCRGARLRMT